jgi:hypothetical protein
MGKRARLRWLWVQFFMPRHDRIRYQISVRTVAHGLAWVVLVCVAHALCAQDGKRATVFRNTDLSVAYVGSTTSRRRMGSR